MDIYSGLTCAGMKMIYGLNLNIRNQAGDWDVANVEQLLRFVKSNKLNMTLELGNEPNSYHHKFGYTMTPQQHAKDLNRLHKLLTKYELYLPVFGPDSTGRSKSAFDYLDNFIQLAPVDGYTYHHYSLSGYSSKKSDYLSLRSFQLFEREVKKWSKMTSRPLMLGETSVSYGGGQERATNRWLGSFLWADKLGQAATNGIQVVMREAFLSSHYGLLGPDLKPNPDYWVTLAFKRLFVGHICPVAIKLTNKKLRVYAAIKGSEQNFLLINFGRR